MFNEEEHSLADFYLPEENGPLEAPPAFTEWMKRSEWAMSLMEPRMHGAAVPRVVLERAGTTHEVVNLSSYNYLGLTHHPEVVAAATEALQRYGTGACGSPLLSGMADLHRNLESKLAEFTGREDVMLFNSGFGGGMGSIASILRKGDVAIVDGKCHLCVLDGVKLSRAKLVFFDHNDPKSLEEALARTEGKRRLVVVEGVYSMDGDTADLPALLPVAEHHKVPVFIDEAHSILCFGDNGRGVVEHYGVEDRVGIQFATFSKSFAAAGSFVASNKELLRYMRYYANGYGFSCALPPSVVAGVTKALEVATRDNSLRETMWANVRYFREKAVGLGLNLGDSTSQVFPIILGSDRRALFELAIEMNEKGLFLAPVDYPSVPENGLRYRVAVTAAHTQEDLDRALNILEDTVVRRIKAGGLAST